MLPTTADTAIFPLPMQVGSGSVAPRSTPIRVLVIEDDPRDAMHLHQLLSRARLLEAEVEAAASLASGMERITAGGVDVVLLDLHLPDSTGIDTFTHLSAFAPGVPVIVLSAYAEEVLAIQAVQLGAQDYLLKGRISAEGIGRAIQCAVQRHHFLASLRGMSLTDELTGLFNRRGFLTLAQGHLELGRRVGSTFLMVFADLDGLKAINDTHGHAVGDRAISSAARLLRETFRQSDVVARFGGDEFAILALDGSADWGAGIRRRLAERVADYNRTASPGTALSMSLGIVPFTQADPRKLPDVMARADRLLYEEKRARKLASTDS